MKESVIYQDILQQGEAKGLQKGLQQGVENVAMELLRNNLSLEDVAKFTKLSLEQVQALQGRLAEEKSSE